MDRTQYDYAYIIVVQQTKLQLCYTLNMLLSLLGRSYLAMGGLMFLLCFFLFFIFHFSFETGQCI